LDGVPNLGTAVVEFKASDDTGGEVVGLIKSGPTEYRAAKIAPSQFALDQVRTARLYDLRAAGVNAGTPAPTPLSASVKADGVGYSH
jgi:hypothetical protein